MSLDHFYLSRYRFQIEALDPMKLPAYKGTTLRGGFGIIFRRMVCFQPQVPTCDECLLRHTCPYPYLFDTFPPPDAEVMRSHTDVPLPMVIEPPLNERRDYAPGDRLTFHITLIGEGNRYLSYLPVAFQELGRRGLGKRRARFSLVSVDAEHPYSGETAPVYQSDRSSIVHNVKVPVFFDECARRAELLSSEELTIEFLTPTRLKDRGRIVRETPPFHVVWRALMRRVSSLSYFHCGRRWEADYRGLADASREVELVDGETRWVVFRRYSTRQEKRIPISGILGRARYRGDLTPFLPVLQLGEFIHVGKATIFGDGRYRPVNQAHDTAP